jgi:hypothetical protein
MNTNKLTTEQLILIIIIMMGLINGLMSCSPKYGCPAQRSLLRGTVHKPTKREIRQAMRYSSWEYVHPQTQIMLPNSRSKFVFTSIK